MITATEPKSWAIRHGDCRELLRATPAASVQCVVTSPPYWGLRDYGIGPSVWIADCGLRIAKSEECEHEWGAALTKSAGGGPSGHPKAAAGSFCVKCGAWLGCLGLEPTLELYVEHMVDVFREVRRVLRDDGTVWLNLGDCYANDGKWGGESANKHGYLDAKSRKVSGRGKRRTGLKPKDMIGLPWRVAFALQADGWWLRSGIVWHKPNPMPESCRDRPTTAHEFVFLLTKRAQYYYDGAAIREPFADDAMGRDGGTAPSERNRGGRTDGFTKPSGIDPSANGGANKRSVWTVPHDQDRMVAGVAALLEGLIEAGVEPEIIGQVATRTWETNPAAHLVTGLLTSVWKIPTSPFSGAHFATFPPALVEPCIKAGTSMRGGCAECGAPWARVTEKQRRPTRPGTNSKVNRAAANEDSPYHGHGGMIVGNRDPQRNVTETVTVGWEPTCDCQANRPAESRSHIDPCLVLDPFAGSGTTVMVARRLGRRAIGLEASAEYCRMAERRIVDDAPLLNAKT